jgi:hypothetical protein
MPTGFDENNALNRMQMDSPASSGPMSRGGIAGFGRQIRKNASGRGIDPVVDLENKAKMAAFQSGLRREEMSLGSDLRKGETTHSHMHGMDRFSAEQRAKATADQRQHDLSMERITAEHTSKTDADIRLHTHKMQAAREYNEEIMGHAGGIENRSFEANPSTGAVKLGVPIKGVDKSQQFSDIESHPLEATPERKAARAADASRAGASVSSTGMAVYPEPTRQDTPVNLEKYDN